MNARCDALRQRNQQSITRTRSDRLVFFLPPATKDTTPEPDLRRRQPKGHEFELPLEGLLDLPELRTVASLRAHDALCIRKLLPQ